MEIKAIGANIVQRVKSPFVRSTSTNPFENNSLSGTPFKGSVLPFADVFQTMNVSKVNKMKMMSASVVSAVSNFGHRVTEPIALFAHRVRTGIANTITNMKALPNKVMAMGKEMSQKVSNNLNWNMFKSKETVSGPKVLSMREINTNASVEDLKTTWLAENNMMAVKGVA